MVYSNNLTWINLIIWNAY